MPLLMSAFSAILSNIPPGDEVAYRRAIIAAARATAAVLMETPTPPAVSSAALVGPSSGAPSLAPVTNPLPADDGVIEIERQIREILRDRPESLARLPAFLEK